MELSEADDPDSIVRDQQDAVRAMDERMKGPLHGDTVVCVGRPQTTREPLDVELVELDGELHEARHVLIPSGAHGHR
jgi:hypothetical protein